MLSIFLSPILLLGLIIILLVWIIWLTYSVIRDRKFYQKLLIGNEEKNLIMVLETLEQNIRKTKADITNLIKKQGEDEQKAKFSVQKIGLVRFNPYSDTGGQQSFAVSLLDGNNSGIIFSQLFGRSGSKWFAKKIIHGKSEDIELTEEEVTAIKKADSKEKQ